MLLKSVKIKNIWTKNEKIFKIHKQNNILTLLLLLGRKTPILDRKKKSVL